MNKLTKKEKIFLTIFITIMTIIGVLSVIFVTIYDKKIERRQKEAFDNALFNNGGTPITEITNKLNDDIDEKTNKITTKYDNMTNQLNDLSSNMENMTSEEIEESIKQIQEMLNTI